MFNSFQTTILIITSCSTATGLISCFLGFLILNATPAQWLCDYDEIPGEEMLQVRFRFKKSGVWGSLVLAAANFGILMTYGLTLYSLLIFACVFILFLISLCDLKYTIIPDQYVIALGVITVALGIYDLLNKQFFIQEWWHIPAGAFFGGIFLFLVNIISILLLKKQGMGFGDVKLMCAVGAGVGFPLIFLNLIAGVLIASVYIVFIFIKGTVTKKEVSHYFPFGPFLCTATALIFIFHQPVNWGISWYISLLTF